MFRSLYFKIVLILLIFIIAVMSAVSAILINGVSTYYTRTFSTQMEECFATGTVLREELEEADTAESENAADDLRAICSTYGSILGIDQYRNYYILNRDGDTLAASDTELGAHLEITPNLLSAIGGDNENHVISGSEYADWAVVLGGGNIVYVKDSMNEMRQLNQTLFSIILQAMLVGIFFSILLAFVLAKAITAPIQSLTRGTQLVAMGNFDTEIEVNSRDELGVLTENFNAMKDRLKETLDEVSGEREKLEMILGCMKDAILTFTVSGKLLHGNSSAASILPGVREGSITLEDCFEAMDIPLVLSGATIRLTSPDAAAERNRDGFVFRDRICGGKVYDVSFGIIRYAENGKMLPGCIVIAHDVTGRYELDQSRREFVANVSHELRTPLTSIKSAAETILEDPAMDEETRNFFLDDYILTECDRMTRIVSDLLTLSRLDNQRTRWNIETFDMIASVKRLCAVMKKDFDEHGHTVTFTADPDVPEITGDRQRLEQVVINILTNANKYTQNGGKIDIHIGRTEKFLVITIVDNGVGIPKEDMAHLFERFYRVEKSRTSDAGGTGLGLAIAKELTEAHGGKISMESTLSKGTSVTIELPFACKLKNPEAKGGGTV